MSAQGNANKKQIVNVCNMHTNGNCVGDACIDYHYWGNYFALHIFIELSPRTP